MAYPERHGLGEFPSSSLSTILIFCARDSVACVKTPENFATALTRKYADGVAVGLRWRILSLPKVNAEVGCGGKPGGFRAS